METKLFKVTATLLEPLLGTVAKDPRIWDLYPPVPAEVLGEETETAPLDDTQKGVTGFHVDEQGNPFIYNYMIVGFLKNAGSVFNGLRGVRNLKSKVENFCFVEPRRIPIPPIAPDLLVRPIRGIGPQGPRVAIVRSEQVLAGGVITFNIKVIKGPISRELLCDLLDYGALKGLGQWRNANYGSFTYTIEDLP